MYTLHTPDIILTIIINIGLILTIIIVININSLYCATHKRRGKSDMYSLYIVEMFGV